MLKEKLIISVMERLEQWYQDTKKEGGSNKKGHNLHAITKQYSYIEDRMLIQTQQQQTIKTSKNKQTRGRDYNYYHLFQSFLQFSLLYEFRIWSGS